MRYLLLAILFYVGLFSDLVFARLDHSLASTNIKMILSLPLENRRQVLLEDRAKASVILKDLVFSSKEGMQIRWAALITLARVSSVNVSRPVIVSALRHPQWFLRNAGLLAMEMVDPAMSLWWADHLLDDPSLLVRTASVDLIRRQKAQSYKWRLLEKLNASDSFYKDSSLWIRHHIIQALADFAEPGEERFFISILQDSDTRLHPFALSALEKITGYRVSDQTVSMNLKHELRKSIQVFDKQKLHGSDNNVNAAAAKVPLSGGATRRRRIISRDSRVWKDRWIHGWLQSQKKSVGL